MGNWNPFVQRISFITFLVVSLRKHNYDLYPQGKLES